MVENENAVPELVFTYLWREVCQASVTYEGQLFFMQLGCSLIGWKMQKVLLNDGTMRWWYLA